MFQTHRLLPLMGWLLLTSVASAHRSYQSFGIGEASPEADGFALVLLATVFLVIGGIGAFAYYLYRRASNLPPAAQMMEEMEKGAATGSAGKSGKNAGEGWERSGDWWKDKV